MATLPVILYGEAQWGVVYWPDGIRNPSFGLAAEQYVKPAVRTPMEGNYVQARPKVTRARYRWPNLGWEIMTADELDILKGFFNAYQGIAFNWRHPVTGTVHTVVFGCDFVNARPVDRTGRNWRAEIALEEL